MYSSLISILILSLKYNFITTCVVFTVTELVLDRILCSYFYYTLTTTTKIMFSIISSYETVDHTEEIIRNFRQLSLTVISAILKIFNNDVSLPVKICIVVAFSLKQHRLAIVGNTRHFLLLILYFQPKKITRDHNEDNVILTTERQDTCTLLPSCNMLQSSESEILLFLISSLI